jgi:hypothetical protein
MVEAGPSDLKQHFRAITFGASADKWTTPGSQTIVHLSHVLNAAQT